MTVVVREVVHIPWVGLLPGRNMNGWSETELGPGVDSSTQVSYALVDARCGLYTTLSCLVN